MGIRGHGGTWGDIWGGGGTQMGTMGGGQRGDVGPPPPTVLSPSRCEQMKADPVLLLLLLVSFGHTGEWGPMGTYGDIWGGWGPIGTYGDIWGHWGTYGDIYGVMG